MDLTYKELSELYKDKFSLHFFGNDINKKFALISLIGYLYFKLKPKKPDLTYWSLIWSIANKLDIPEDILKRVSIICEDFSYGCTSFPTFGIEDKDIPAKVKELLGEYLPF